MKTFYECLENAENKFSRKSGPDGYNVDTLYPILKTIITEGIKEWLDAERPKSVESTDEIIVNDFINHLIESVQSHEAEKK